MAQFYFFDVTVSSTALDLLTNYWNDASHTDPSLGFPTSSDSIQFDVGPGSGSVSANNITDISGSFANAMTGGTVNLSGSATGVKTNGGQIVAAASPISAVGCWFNSDPQFAASISTVLNASGTCLFAGNIGANSPLTINDDGTGQWGNGASINANQINAPAMNPYSGGIVNFNATAIACSSINLPGMMLGNITQGPGLVDLIVAAGQPGNPVTWTGVTGIGEIGLNCVASQSRDPATGITTYVLNGAGGTVTATLTPPIASQIVFGQTVQGVDGTQHVPSAANTISGVSVGTTVGTYQRPNNAASDTLAKPYVDSTVAFGPAGAVQGTDIAGALATNKVKSGTAYGPAGVLMGTLASGGGGSPSVRPGVLG